MRTGLVLREPRHAAEFPIALRLSSILLIMGTGTADPNESHRGAGCGLLKIKLLNATLPTAQMTSEPPDCLLARCEPKTIMSDGGVHTVVIDCTSP
jgi:hypothetical protein